MPRELIITENTTVDGVIDMSGGWFDPTGPDDPDALEEMREVEERLRSTADAVLLGRNTFEAFRSFWPNQTDDRTGVSDYLDRVAKYVVSSTITEPGWAGTTVLRGDVADEVGALKAGEGGDIVATGSITLVHALDRLGLADEYRLFVYPVVAGGGARLFPDPHAQVPLRLVEAHRFRSGVALLRYRRD